LETGCRLESIAEGQELQRGDGLEHVDLRDERLEDLEDPVQEMQGTIGVTVLERELDTLELVAERLEPELVDLVHDDEQQLVMLGAIGAGRLLDLQREQLRDLQVRRVGDGSAGHQPMVRRAVETAFSRAA
jgi:hypothetical protein